MLESDGAAAVRGPAASSLTDAAGRTVDYARFSLTDRCNFRCAYCMPHEGLAFIPHERIVSYEELLRLARVLTGLGVTRYKVTGGEPLCRKSAVGFIRNLAALPGVSDVTLTTNGSLVGKDLEYLAKSGVSTINFSCDAFSREVSERISRSVTSPAAIRETIQRAADLGLRVKINTVPIRHHNEAELASLARFALERGWHIRFIELMPIGSGRLLHGVPLPEVRAMLEREFGPLHKVAWKTGNGPAIMFSVKGFSGLVGFIAALSDRFCAACNRVRVTSTGFLKTCLCHDAGVDLKAPLADGATDEELALLIHNAVKNKPAGHIFSFADPCKDDFFMSAVGG